MAVPSPVATPELDDHSICVLENKHCSFMTIINKHPNYMSLAFYTVFEVNREKEIGKADLHTMLPWMYQHLLPNHLDTSLPVLDRYDLATLIAMPVFV